MKSRSAPKSRLQASRSQPEAVEVELIRSLFHAFVPSVVMTLGFMIAGAVILMKTGDLLLLALLIVGALASSARLATAWLLMPVADRPNLSLAEARRIERRFAKPYLIFALTLGLFGARTFMLNYPDVHMLSMCLLIGYCAGVAVGIGLRLWIAVPAMIVALVPAMVVALWTPDILYWVTSALGLALLLGGTHSLRRRHDRSAKDISLRLAFANLARKDALTALPNRIALREWYEERVALGTGEGKIAVHYVDLNGFKPVNDSYGHPVGDALLVAVGKRIANAIRENDIAARLGGDEFVIIQFGIADAAEAGRLAARLSAAIARPFRIGQRIISISTGLGYVVADGREEDLDHLLGLADQALYASKRDSGTVTQYDAVEAMPSRAA